MKYNSEQVQTLYHKMSVDLQIAINELEEKLYELGFTVTIANVKDHSRELEIIVRIAD